MDIILDKTRKLTPIKSVTNDISSEAERKLDTEAPLPFLEWIESTGLSSETPEDYMSEYTTYLKKWSIYNKLSNSDSSQVIITRYKALLKDIALNHTSDDEKRFLSNIDYDNPRHVESALPFFARKLKQIALYYTQERDNIKQQNTRTKLSGTTLGTSELAYKYVPQLLRRDDLTLKFQNNTVEISTQDIYTNFKVDIDELYDISQEYFKSEKLPINIDVHTDIASAIQEVLEECKPVLKLSNGASLILNNTATGVEPDVTADDLNILHRSYFQRYTQDINELNVYVEADYIPTLVGSNISYLSGGTITPVLSSDTHHRNMFNRYGPVINNKAEPVLKSVKELGGYFTPAKLGTLTYYSNKPTYNVTSDSTSIIVPELDKYGNSAAFGVTGIPVEHVEHIEWLKAGIGTGRLKGDIVADRSYQKFYNYSSIEEMSENSRLGVSRTTDKLGFFDGDKADVWSMEDVYEQPARNIYDIDGRQETMLTEMGTLITWRTDIYGNEYAMFKHVSPERSPVDMIPEDEEDRPEAVITCETVDGGETLVKHPDMYGSTDFEIFDGGRHPGLDPKPEQSNLSKPFPDIREPEWDGSSFVTPEHTTAYFGYDPTGISPNLDRYPITFHGFRRLEDSPAYDRQMYCGLFTDTECGVLFSNLDRCVIADNYVFQTFTDIISGDNRISTHAQLPRDAFDVYTAPGKSEVLNERNPEYVGFTTWGQSASGVKVTEGNKLDGDSFLSEACKNIDAEYFYDITNNVPLFLGETNVSETKRSEPRRVESQSLTNYQQKNAPTGRGIFRSYNGKKIITLSEALEQVLKYYSFFDGSDFDLIQSSIENGEIVDIDVLYDVIVIQTADHLYIEKVQFDPTTCEIKPSGSSNVVLRTWDTDPEREKLIGWFFDEKKNRMLTGTTCLDGDTVYVKLFDIDLETLQYKQVFPNNDYPESSESFELPEDLLDTVISTVDTPIIAYNETTDVYNVTFGATLSSSNKISQAYICSDYKDQKLNYQLIDSSVHYSTFVPMTDTRQSLVSQSILLPGRNLKPAPLTPPVNEHKTFNMSMSSMLGHVLSAQSLELEILCTDLPVTSNSHKINEIIVDYGDGESDNAVRLIDMNAVGNVDLISLPDPGDVNDPRVNIFNHTYVFNKSEPDTITATVSAIYSDFSTYTYNINIETSPYTIASGFDGLKLINSKTFTDLNGINKQVLTLETQNPQHVTDVVLTR